MNFNKLSLKFSQDMYMKMLTDDMNTDEELRDAIINDFMKSIENYRRIHENELTCLLQKYARKLYKKAMYRVGYDMFDYEGNRDGISAYIGKFTFDEYTDMAYFYLGALKNDLLSKKSKMLKKKHQNARDFLFTRVYRVVDKIMNGINYVSDFSKCFTVHYSNDKATIDEIMTRYIITMTRAMSAMILYDRSMARNQKAEKELYRVEKPEFIKPDVGEIMRYAECEDLVRLPYNIESFLYAAINALNLVYRLVYRGNFDNEGIPTATERKFYGAMANIQAEIRNRILNNRDIEVVTRDLLKLQSLIGADDMDDVKSAFDIKDSDLKTELRIKDGQIEF